MHALAEVMVLRCITSWKPWGEVPYYFDTVLKKVAVQAIGILKPCTVERECN